MPTNRIANSTLATAAITLRGEGCQFPVVLKQNTALKQIPQLTQSVRLYEMKDRDIILFRQFPCRFSNRVTAASGATSILVDHPKYWSKATWPDSRQCQQLAHRAHRFAWSFNARTFWLDQDQHEWVPLLQDARLSIEGES